MKKNITLLIFVFAINYICAQKINNRDIIKDTIWVRPGIGIDDIKINKTKQKKVKNYKNLNFVRKQSKTNLCLPINKQVSNSEYISTHYLYRLDGMDKPREISFVFTSRNEDKLEYIKINQIQNTCLKSEICIGETYYDDIIKIMGNQYKKIRMIY